MARLLQSLDDDGKAKGGIVITAEVIGCLEQALAQLGLTRIDFADDSQVEEIIQETIILAAALDIVLVAISAEDAGANLEKSLNNSMFRKRISRTTGAGQRQGKTEHYECLVPGHEGERRSRFLH